MDSSLITIGKTVYYSMPNYGEKTVHAWWIPKKATVLKIGKPGLHQRIKIKYDNKESWVPVKRISDWRE